MGAAACSSSLQLWCLERTALLGPLVAVGRGAGRVHPEVCIRRRFRPIITLCATVAAWDHHYLPSLTPSLGSFIVTHQQLRHPKKVSYVSLLGSASLQQQARSGLHFQSDQWSRSNSLKPPAILTQQHASGSSAEQQPQVTRQSAALTRTGPTTQSTAQGPCQMQKIHGKPKSLFPKTIPEGSPKVRKKGVLSSSP